MGIVHAVCLCFTSAARLSSEWQIILLERELGRRERAALAEKSGDTVAPEHAAGEDTADSGEQRPDGAFVLVVSAAGGDSSRLRVIRLSELSSGGQSLSELSFVEHSVDVGSAGDS